MTMGAKMTELDEQLELLDYKLTVLEEQLQYDIELLTKLLKK